MFLVNHPLITESLEQLEKFVVSPQPVDRADIVAHATLSAFMHHWPTQGRDEWIQLLQQTHTIRETEKSRWLTQRRIALAKLAKI